MAVNGQEISLTYKEFELLCYLLENRGVVLTRDQILSKIWDYNYSGETRTVDVHIRTLRQKLGAMGALDRDGAASATASPKRRRSRRTGGQRSYEKRKLSGA